MSPSLSTATSPGRTGLLVLALALVASPDVHAALVDPFQPLPWAPVGSQANGGFAESVAAAGDVNGDGYGDVIVGAQNEKGTFDFEGAAYLYLGSPQGSSPTPAWEYRSGQLGAGAGLPVASAGDVNGDGYADVLVAVVGWDTPGHTDVGKVAVFHGGPAGLPLVPTYELFSPIPADGQKFGIAVAPAGDVNGDGYADVLVGAYVADGAFTSRGGAFVFHGGPSGLASTPARTWLGPAGQNSQFGRVLSSAGDVNGDGFADVIIGAPAELTPFTFGGTASLYLGSAAGAMALPDTVIKGLANDAQCGFSVSLAGDVNGDGYGDVLIGFPGVNSSAGKAELAFGGPNGLASAIVVPTPEAPPNTNFGRSVATLGDLDGDGYADFAVGAYQTPSFDGRIGVYRGGRTQIEYVGELLPPPNSDFFGSSFGTTGDADGDGRAEILVGTEDAQRAFQYRPPRALPRLAPGWPRSGAQPGTRYGSALAVLNRFDGVVQPRLMIGDPQFDSFGRISFHFGSTTNGVTFTEASAITASLALQGFGTRIVDAGDMNGDGFCEYAVSSPTLDNGPIFQAGMVELQPGALGSPPLAFAVGTGQHDFDRVGSALAGRGDVNGDGYHDLLVGAREWDEPTVPDCGKVFLFFGSPTGPTASPWTRVGSDSGQGLGAGVALADLDGDGYTDVILGSSSPTFGSPRPGKVEVYYGGPGGPSTTPGLVLAPESPSTSYGLTVAAIGDVTGDQIADLAVGAPREDGHGVVRLYAGTLGRSQTRIPIATLVGTQAGARYGEAIAGGGDVDGDGFGDLVIGEPGWDGGQSDEGRFLLHFGAPIVPETTPALVVESNIVGAELGASMAPLRDVNLDGFADVIVGAPGAAGRVYPFLGGGGSGKKYNLQLLEPFAGNVQRFHPARTTDPDHFGVFFTAQTAGGKARLKFEFEVVPQNEPFTGTPTVTSGTSSFDTGTPGSELLINANPSLSPALPGRALHLRGRWTSPSPYFPRSRWLTPEAHTSGDHDVWLTGTSVGVAPPGTPDVPRGGIAAVAPNPATRAAASAIGFVLPRAGRVSLDVFDLRGARVRRLLDESRPAGRSTASWDGRDDGGREVGAGVYFVVWRAEGASDRAKLVRLP